MISIVVYGRYGVAWRLDGAKRREEDLAKAVCENGPKNGASFRLPRGCKLLIVWCVVRLRSAMMHQRQQHSIH